MTVTELLQADPFAQGLGVRLVDVDVDRVTIAADVTPHHADASGRLSTGVLFALADCALSLISNADRSAVAVATHLTRVAEIPSGVAVLTASIEPVSDPGARAVTYRAMVTAEGALVAQFTGTTLAVG